MTEPVDIKPGFLNRVKEEAIKELAQEREEKAKRQIKDKLKMLENAKLVVKNLIRELDDLYAELSE